MPRGRQISHERAAMVLCDAVMLGDRASANKWNISERTLQRYRARLESDDKLRQLVAEYRDKQTEKWLEDIPVALSVFVKFCTKAAQEMDHKADNMMAVVAAFEAIADVHLTHKIVDGRLKDAEE